MASASERPDVHQKVQKILNEKGVKSLQRIDKFFRTYSGEKFGDTLSFEKMRLALRDYGLELTQPEFQTLFNSFDKDGNGCISITEFITALRPAMSESRRKLVNRAFDKLDKTGDGLVTVADISNIYDVSKHPKYQTGEFTKEQVLIEFLKQFQISPDVDDTITRQEFLDYYAMVGANVEKDIYFDFMIRNSWKL